MSWYKLRLAEAIYVGASDTALTKDSNLETRSQLIALGGLYFIL